MSLPTPIKKKRYLETRKQQLIEQQNKNCLEPNRYKQAIKNDLLAFKIQRIDVEINEVSKNEFKESCAWLTF